MVVEAIPHRDVRGSFRRLWCHEEFAEHGLLTQIVQVSLSDTKRCGTLRGMHFQLPPSREGKLVQCVAGRIYDVALDLRRRSPSFLAHFGLELSPETNRALFIPAGCAHGFLTLADDCTVLYMTTDFYHPALSAGVRWNDPRFKITWPAQPTEILPRDAHYADFDDDIADKFADY
jgi:dTDP-4-dehydrorhamnose 3,5-epimerase